MQGWVKLHRTVTDSFVFQNPDRLKFWIWCLCKATHKERVQTVGLQEVNLKPGQFVFGRKKASSELSMDESKVYRLIKTFEKREKIEVKSNNKFSVITVVNWAFYQDTEQQNEQQSNNKITTNEQQSNTNKNVKNDNNEIIEEVWRAYPNKKGKKDSFKKIPKILKSVSKDDLIKAIERYDKSVVDKNYLMNGSTFFNGRYEDYLEDEVKEDYTPPKYHMKAREEMNKDGTY